MKAGTTSVASSFDLQITATTDTGFALVDQVLPINAYAGRSVSMPAPYVVNPGSVATNVKYKWTASSQNTTQVSIAGATSSTASFVPPVAGQYSFNVEASAIVNGIREVSTQTMVVVVQPASVSDIITAGDAKVVANNAVTTLSGSILNRDSSMNYGVRWTQLSGAQGGPAVVSLSNASTLTPSFLPTVAGTYSFQLEVTKSNPSTGAVLSVSTSQTQVTVQGASAAVYTVSAGEAKVAALNTAVFLTSSLGSQGVATDQVAASYQWSQIGGPAVSLANATTSQASFIPTVAGSYQFQVAVSASVAGGTPSVSTASTSVLVPEATVADGYGLSASAGAVQTIASPGAPVALSGGVATTGNAAGVTYSYQWTQTGGPSVTLSSANTQSASFIPPSSGTYSFSFQVTSSSATAASKTSVSTTQVVVKSPSAQNFAMGVSAGAPQTVNTSAVATLNAALDLQGDSLGVTFAYQWSQLAGAQGGPTTVSLSNANNRSANFLASVAGTYGFELSVVASVPDGTTRTAKAQTQVLVTTANSSSSFAISASAGPAQSVAANAVASLNGSVSTQGTTTGTTFAYQWSQLAGAQGGPAVLTISNANSTSATVIPSVPGTYGFQLQVTATLGDGTTRTVTSQTQVVVGSAGGSTFTVSAGDAKTLSVNSAAVMSGAVTAQGDSTGVTYAYQWGQVGVSPTAVTVSNANSATASFAPTVPGTYTFQLQVIATSRDGSTQTRTATTQVLVTP